MDSIATGTCVPSHLVRYLSLRQCHQNIYIYIFFFISPSNHLTRPYLTSATYAMTMVDDQRALLKQFKGIVHHTLSLTLTSVCKKWTESYDVYFVLTTIKSCVYRFLVFKLD